MTHKPRSNAESILIADIVAEFGSHPDLFMWRANTGKARRGRAVIKFNIPGTADILGCIAPHGRMFGLEAKSEDGTQSDEQRTVEEAMVSRGALYLLVRSVEDVRVGLRAAGVRV